MNLIIDIPNERYELLKAVNKQLGSHGATQEELAILNGVLLKEVADDIKAEIEQHCNITVGSDNEPAMTLYDIFGILDKHISGKETE